MGLCRRNTAKVPARRSQTAGISAVAPPPSDLPKEQPPQLTPEAEAGEELAATPRSLNDRSSTNSHEAAEAVAASATRGVIGRAGVHSQDPPARNDSATTSCAGMTDADYMSRGSTLQAEIQSLQRAASSHAAKESKRAQADKLQEQSQPQSQEPLLAITDPPQPREEETTLAVPAQQAAPLQAQTQEPRAASPEPLSQLQDQEPVLALEDKEKPLAIADHAAPRDSPARHEARTQAGAASHLEGVEEVDAQEGGPRTSDLATKVSETFSTVKQSLSRGYQSLRSVNVTESFRRAPTEVMPELQEAEQCVCGVLNDLTELGERALPCLSGEHADEYTEAVQLPTPQITMVVNTPAGPYLRRIPDALVEEAINMGFISEEEVMRQREEWQQTYGPIPIGYTPAISFAEQQA